MQNFSSLGSQEKNEGWDEPDPNVDYSLKTPVQDYDNPYDVPFVIRSDLIYLVHKFGYPLKAIFNSIVRNESSHMATTYYLYEKDHERIF